MSQIEDYAEKVCKEEYPDLSGGLPCEYMIVA